MASNVADIILQRQDAYRALFLRKDSNDLKWWQKIILRLLPERYGKIHLEDLTWEARVVLDDLVSFCNVNESVFDTDPLIMAFKSGKREYAQRVLANLHIDLGDVVSINQSNEEGV